MTYGINNGIINGTVININNFIDTINPNKIYLDIEEDDYKVVLKNIYKLAKQVNPDVKLSEEKGEQGKTNFITVRRKVS